MLDLGCGTGDTDFEGRTVVGLDPVVEMLALSPVPARVVGIGEHLPFADDGFDGVFSGFVFRNLDSVDQTMAEVRQGASPRVGRGGGRSLPTPEPCAPGPASCGDRGVAPAGGAAVRRCPPGVLVPAQVAGLPATTRGAPRRSRSGSWKRCGDPVCSASYTGPD